MYKTVNQYLLESTSGFRCGIVLPYQILENTFNEFDGVYNVSVPEAIEFEWKTASGGISFNKNDAIMKAIGEALERYSAHGKRWKVKKLDEIKNEDILLHKEFSLFSEEQYNIPNFKWKKINESEAYFGEMYSLYDNKKCWIPQELIGLGSQVGTVSLLPSTSTGIAAHTDKYKAILSAIYEVLERDALTCYWQNSLGGREIELDNKYISKVKEKFGEIYCFDITQEWNPCPVVIICGYLMRRGEKRFSLGVACRSNYKEAIEKSYLEWVQGCIFAGYYKLHHPSLIFESIEQVDNFDKHAVYYTIHPERWNNIPLIKKSKKAKIDKIKGFKNEYIIQNLKDLLRELKSNEIRMYYKDLTIEDIKQVGVTVVRVVSPELSLLHGDENIPFLGGRTNDVLWRYPSIDKNEVVFPNKFPHPLG